MKAMCLFSYGTNSISKQQADSGMFYSLIGIISETYNLESFSFRLLYQEATSSWSQSFFKFCLIIKNFMF